MVLAGAGKAAEILIQKYTSHPQCGHHHSQLTATTCDSYDDKAAESSRSHVVQLPNLRKIANVGVWCWRLLCGQCENPHTNPPLTCWVSLPSPRHHHAIISATCDLPDDIGAESNTLHPTRLQEFMKIATVGGLQCSVLSGWYEILHTNSPVIHQISPPSAFHRHAPPVADCDLVEKLRANSSTTDPSRLQEFEKIATVGGLRCSVSSEWCEIPHTNSPVVRQSSPPAVIHHHAPPIASCATHENMRAGSSTIHTIQL